LLTQKIAPSFTPVSNREAWSVLDRLMDDECIGLVPEPDDLASTWRLLSSSDQSSPKTWMDAYLAAFAITAKLRLVTLDNDFTKFEAQGLDVQVLVP